MVCPFQPKIKLDNAGDWPSKWFPLIFVGFLYTACDEESLKTFRHLPLLIRTNRPQNFISLENPPFGKEAKKIKQHKKQTNG